MLNINNDSHTSRSHTREPDKISFDIFYNPIRILNRQRRIVVVVFVCSLLLGLLYYFITSPSFTAMGTIVIDKRKVQLFQKESVLGEMDVDTATIQTEVEVLKSDNISLAVIRKLRLTGDPEFAGSSHGMFGRLIGLLAGTFKAPGPPTEFERESAALATFDANRTVTRQGMTYVMSLGFTSHDAEKSARIVNALAEAYIDDQLNAKYQATRRASVWLQERLTELRTQAMAAERAVLDFKGRNNIVDTGGGRLIGEQQLTEVNSQLILARAETAEAKARLDRINAVVTQDLTDASVTDALKSEVIVKLRAHYLELAARQSFWSKQYGEDHLAAINIRNQMQALRRSINDEMKKIAESYKSDYEIALARQKSLEGGLSSVVTESRTTGQAQIQLRELESSAETSRALYDTFLQRYMESVQQLSIPISEARMISPAMQPLKKSAPKLSIVLLLTFAGGAVLSFAVAYLREGSDGTLRTTGHVEDKLHLNCLATVPILKPPATHAGSKTGKAPDTAVSAMALNQDWLRYAVDAPFSRYAEAIRSVKIAADLGGALKSHRTIGVTSTLPNEGKSTIAANLAYLIADTGGSVVLVDADLRGPSLSRQFAPNSPGLIGAVAGKLPLEEAIIPIPCSSLKFLPSGSTARIPHTNEILASDALKKCIELLRANYDYVVIDLSPVAPVVDVRATGHFIDTYVYVVEWGETKAEIIQQALAEAGNVSSRVLGVVLNKVDSTVQSRYEPYHGSKYHRKYYAKYGYTD
ncbi:MAG: polysaccharide biosynthesis tyrosine autokinase [Beijerinckiaceae bacterium]|nr:polysaccharide biosynthesis tyrosine autokinase [Beijerinckiaceae bacterium]